MVGAITLLNKDVTSENNLKRFVVSGPILTNAPFTDETMVVGSIYDAISCTVTEEINGRYELDMEYPYNGYMRNFFELGQIIMAKPNAKSDRQPFRIVSISESINGSVSIKANHLSYDLDGIMINAALSYTGRLFTLESPFKPLDYDSNSLFKTLITLKKILGPMRFKIWLQNNPNRSEVAFQNMESTPNYTIDGVTSVRSILCGFSNTLRGRRLRVGEHKEDAFDKTVSGITLSDLYGGEWTFDCFSAYLQPIRGRTVNDVGVTLKYGTNIISESKDSTIEGTYTHIYAYYKFNYTYNYKVGDEEKSYTFSYILNRNDLDENNTILYPIFGAAVQEDNLTQHRILQLEYQIPDDQVQYLVTSYTHGAAKPFAFNATQISKYKNKLEQELKGYVTANYLDKNNPSFSIESNVKDIELGDEITLEKNNKFIINSETVHRVSSITYDALNNKVQSFEIGDIVKDLSYVYTRGI